MKKLATIAALITIIYIHSFSQIVFENGYFINESDQKINCLIRNVEWMNNPTSFQYKLSREDSVQKADTKTVKEFSIIGESKFIRATVKIDKSSNILEKLSSDRNPVFVEETLFLKLLVEGNASLYKYESEGNSRFFYKKNDSEITQLVYKQYLLNEAVAYNFYYRQQLMNEFNISSNDVEDVDYSEKDIKRVFIKLSGSSGSDSHALKQKRDFFNLTLRPGLNLGSLLIEKPGDYLYSTDFGSKLALRFGIEAELILPFNKNKWGIILEPTYQYYTSEQSTITHVVSGEILNSKARYQSIELPIGIRYYLFLNNKSKIHLNVSYMIEFISNSGVKFYRNDGSEYHSFDLTKGKSIFFGIGYKYKDKYSIEIQKGTNRDIMNYPSWDSKYSVLSLMIGYTLI